MFEPGSVNGRHGAANINKRTNQKHQNSSNFNDLDWKWQKQQDEYYST